LFTKNVGVTVTPLCTQDMQILLDAPRIPPGSEIAREPDGVDKHVDIVVGTTRRARQHHRSVDSASVDDGGPILVADRRIARTDSFVTVAHGATSRVSRPLSYNLPA